MNTFNKTYLLINKIYISSSIRSCITLANLQNHSHRNVTTKHRGVQWFCTSDRDTKHKFASNKELVIKEFKSIIQDKKQKLNATEQKILQRAQIIAQDVRDTKNKVKETVENIIERENVYTIPNFLSVMRIAITPYLGLLIVQHEFNYALIVLGVAAVTDLLDGWIARTWSSQSSKMGSFLDPMADKVLIATLFLSLTYVELIPIVLTSLIIGRDALLIIAGFVIRYESLPPPRTLSRYFDVTHATAELAPTTISKINTAIQLLLVGSTLAAPVFNYVNHPALECLWYVTGASTIAAALSYILSKNTFQYLKDRRAGKK